MKGKLKCLSCSAIFTLLFIVSLCFPTYAAEYGNQYPGYVNQSGGCFVECQTNLGKGSIIFAINYQEDTIGFYGTGNNLMNISNSAVSGYFVSENGTTYDIRASGFSTFQYYTGNNWGGYTDLTVSQIYNTNVQFTDAQGDRGNTFYNFSNFEKILLCLGFLLFAMSIIHCIVVFGRR